MKYRNARIPILSIVSLLVAMPTVADTMIVAEYRADKDASAVFDAKATNLGVEHPWGVKQQSVNGSFGRDFKLGRHKLFGFFDISQSQLYASDSLYGIDHSIKVGPALSFTPNTSTHFFYGLNQAEVLREYTGPRRGGDSTAQRTGLAHAWYDLGRGAEITLGYEFEQRSLEDRYDDRRAHSINLSGRFPLFWGMRAEVEADYARNSYYDYRDAGAAESSRQLLRAAVDRAISERLYGELQFSYLTEEFDDAELSYRRQIWGLNLRYRY